MSITRISQERIYAAEAGERKEIDFSPLDFLILGHFPLGAIYGFRQHIDADRFRNALSVALNDNIEMGAVIRIGKNERHRLVIGSGVEFIVQDCDEAMPGSESMSGLSLEDYPLARVASLTAHDIAHGDVPLLGFTITHFNDGCTLGVRTTHSHVDGTALTQFIVSVGEIYRGGIAEKPETGRERLANLVSDAGKAPSGAFPFIYMKDLDIAEDAFRSADPNAFTYNYVLFEGAAFQDYIDRVKRECEGITSSDIVCASGWKAWALSSPLEATTASRLYSLFDIRKTLNLSELYQGNAVIDRMVEFDFGRARSVPVAEIAEYYRNKVKPIKRDEVLQDLAYFSRLYREGKYREDGSYSEFVRRFAVDMATGEGLFLNDIRQLKIGKVCFDQPAAWYDSGQDYHGRGYLEVSQRHDGTVVFRYHSTLREAVGFEDNLRNLVGA